MLVLHALTGGTGLCHRMTVMLTVEAVRTFRVIAGSVGYEERNIDGRDHHLLKTTFGPPLGCNHMSWFCQYTCLFVHEMPGC